MLDVSFYLSFILQPNAKGKGLKCERPSYKYMRDDTVYVSIVLKNVSPSRCEPAGLN